MTSTDEIAESAGPLCNPPLDPATDDFVDRLTFNPPIHALLPVDARAVLVAMQSRPTGKPVADVEDVSPPSGPQGVVRVRLVRPAESKERLPVIMFFHGGGWILGDATPMIVSRENWLSGPMPLSRWSNSVAPRRPIPLRLKKRMRPQCIYSSIRVSLNLDGSRIAVVGDCSAATSQRP